MLFNSYIFIFVFLPITLIGYWYWRKKNKENMKRFLLICSLYFYSFFYYKYVLIIIGSILFNYFIGKKIFEIKEKYFLYIGIIGNLGLICYFKYYNFFIENINYLTEIHIDKINMILPLGISFFTFQQIAYLVDMWRGEGENYDFLSYALFVTFFPQLIAGPIIHYKEIIPQINKATTKNYYYINQGIYIFILGLFKKVIIADWIGKFATQGYLNIENITFAEAWIMTISYSLQLYFDFSGYSDMAIGIGKMFNINIPLNFNSPYKARDIEEFWRKWHITLGRFLTDYIYIPLGGSREGIYRGYVNMLTVFLISGLWHGAGWNFILWGFIHGVAVIVTKILKKYKINRILLQIMTLIFINVAWVFFRAESLKDAVRIIKIMFFKKIEMHPLIIEKLPKYFQVIFVENRSFLSSLSISLQEVIAIVVLGIGVLYLPNVKELGEKFKLTKINLSIMVILLYIIVINLNSVSTFLYFNF